uniref:Alkaline phosphodiesterase I / Nucleotide pyrophosphatase n=1 Tax=uncultured bacterium contig00046 TaxID=1181532 RepID=A0A806KB07_9BACT|nr:alkaline phosphodiesterase I / Nucleotide pyrophosphatase [uncultured bacterium contig00046]
MIIYILFMKKSKMIILSFDSLSGEDFEFMKTLPAFAEFFENAAICTNVSSVYPSLTYPAHASIVTGKHPEEHGIIDNTLFQPNRMESPDWFWQRKFIKAETIYDLAIEKGMKVGAFLWPTTGKSKIQYNVPEVLPNRFWDNQIFASLRNGSPLFQLELLRHFGHILDGIKQPALDDFVTECVIHTIKTKAPEMILAHFTDLDTARHKFGVFSEEAYEAIRRLERRFDKMVGMLRATSLPSIIILGDHAQIDVKKEIDLNKILTNAVAKSCGGSAYIYVKPEFEAETEKQLKQIDGVEWILPKPFGFMAEAVEGVTFNHSLKADHGYHPDKPRYKTFFAAAGPEIKKRTIEQMSLVDIAPFIAEVMGLKFHV